MGLHVAMIEGEEPYEMDFGDREYDAWLIKHLTADEYAARTDAWGAYVRLADRIPRVLRFARRVITWQRHRAYRRFDALARARGGPAPGPSWKVRHDFGDNLPEES